ncbi:TetR-family transcriptional regulator [Streptomyces sp. SPB78]|nr:TetR-family transcriptional regulator [Streptomyces sp. SPB78]
MGDERGAAARGRTVGRGGPRRRGGGRALVRRDARRGAAPARRRRGGVRRARLPRHHDPRHRRARGHEPRRALHPLPHQGRAAKRITRVGHDKSLAVLSEAAEGPGGAAQRLAGAVRAFVRWHAAHHTTARIVQYELDALDPAHRTEIVALRRRTEAVVRGVIEDGVRTGAFDVPDVPGTTLAVLSLCIDVARWFNAAGRRTPEQIGDLYADLVLRMVGAAPGEGDEE